MKPLSAACRTFGKKLEPLTAARRSQWVKHKRKREKYISIFIYILTLAIYNTMFNEFYKNIDNKIIDKYA